MQTDRLVTDARTTTIIIGRGKNCIASSSAKSGKSCNLCGSLPLDHRQTTQLAVNFSVSNIFFNINIRATSARTRKEASHQSTIFSYLFTITFFLLLLICTILHSFMFLPISSSTQAPTFFFFSHIFNLFFYVQCSSLSILFFHAIQDVTSSRSSVSCSSSTSSMASSLPLQPSIFFSLSSSNFIYHSPLRLPHLFITPLPPRFPYFVVLVLSSPSSSTFLLHGVRSHKETRQ